MTSTVRLVNDTLQKTAEKEIFSPYFRKIWKTAIFKWQRKKSGINKISLEEHYYQKIERNILCRFSQRKL